jgi:hypothetical protein
MNTQRRKQSLGIPTSANTEQSADSKVVNLSDHQLSKEEKSILSKGLSFCPTTPLDTIQVCGDLEEFFRRMRLKKYFSDKDEETSESTENGPQPFTCTSHQM